MNYFDYFSNLLLKYYNKDFGNMKALYGDAIESMRVDLKHITCVIKLTQEYDNVEITIKIRDLYWDFYETRDMCKNLTSDQWNKVRYMMNAMTILVRTVRYIAGYTCRQ